MDLRKLILVNNDCYKAGKKIDVKGIMVHSTGANNPWLKRYVGPDDGFLGVNKNGNHWNTARPGGIQVCVHAFIGKLADGSIATYQTLPWNHRGWHGGGSSNNTHIGFEICEDGLADANYFNAVYKEAVELCAYLCKEFNLTEQNIICHSEGYKKGIASNHGDVMHWFPKHGKSMDTFRADVKRLLSNKEDEPMTLEEKQKFNMLVDTVEGIRKKVDELATNSNKMVYACVDGNMPEWARPTITKLCEKGYLRGDQEGKLNLTDDMIRIMVVLDRAGAFDK